MAPESEPQWPPRSPHEALISTPGGRRRYREMLEQTSPSPSSRKGTRNIPAVNIMQQMETKDEDEEEEEDEETLQLKLQEIQARLKLKKLQSAKTKKLATEDDTTCSLAASASSLGASPQRRPRPTRGGIPGDNENLEPPSWAQVQVPASPVRKVQAPQEQTSPSVLLGIDKGLKAKDVSLKRAPSLRKTNSSIDTSQTGGGYLRRARTPNPNASSSEASARPLSFNERLAAVRTEEATKAERQQRIQSVRTTTFGINQEEMERYKQTAIEIPDEPLVAPTFSREEILGQPGPGPASHLNSLPQSEPPPLDLPLESMTTFAAKKKLAPGEVPESEASAFEPYSSFHLSKRILPHTVLARQVSGKSIYTLPKLLKAVKAPDFALPDIEQDVVVFAILAKKSEPRSHKAAPEKKGGKSEDRGKYMVMTLVDLKWEVDLFLFNSGFTRFWKLTTGTVVAILNPTIMPPPAGRYDTGKFSLVVNSDEDSIIEIGTSRDLGFCQSMKRDGSLCSDWINKKRTQHCEFHSNEAIRKQRGSRVEVNGAGYGARKSKSGEVWGYNKPKHEAKSKPDSNYDRDTGSRWFASRSMSAADLIDGKDRTVVDRKEHAEFVRRGLEAKERERDIMQKLGKIGSAAGKEYMQRASSRANSGPSSGIASSQSMPFLSMGDDEPPPPDAKTLGLLSKDKAVHLSPIKRKRADSSQASSVASVPRSALGWGSNLKDKLAKMKEGEKLRGDQEPPVRKKTRFVTEKGIREAGRESLGNDLADRMVTFDDDDEDELVILK